jgi:GNAT superfamily N-acetyltransferase
VRDPLRELTGEDFVAGPGMGEDDLDIDNIFAKTFERVRREMLDDDPHAFDPDDPRDTTPSDFAAGYTFQNVVGGLALIDPAGEIVGGFFSCDLTLRADHRGKGLGAEIVIEYFLRNEELPTWSLDTPAYSKAGLAAHRSAWRRMKRDPDMVARKCARYGLDSQQDAGQPLFKENDMRL